MTRLALLTALVALALTAACIPNARPSAAPVPATETAQPERPMMATVTVTGRERCPSTHEGFNFAGSQREGDTATCFYR